MKALKINIKVPKVEQEIPKAVRDYFHDFYVITWWELIHSQWGYTREDWDIWIDVLIRRYIFLALHDILWGDKK